MTPQDLVEIEYIKRLKYRYQRATDTQDWVLMRSVFTADAHAWYDSGKMHAHGGDAITAMLAGAMDGKLVSSHVALHPEIELLGPAEATGRWRMEDTVLCLVDAPHMRKGDELRGAGYYTDEYAKVDGEWKISSIGYVRLFHRVESLGQRQLTVEADPARGVLERIPEAERRNIPQTRRA